MVVISASGEERGLFAEVLCDLETQHAMIKVDGSLQVGNLQVHMTDANLAIDWLRHRGILHALHQRAGTYRIRQCHFAPWEF